MKVTTRSILGGTLAAVLILGAQACGDDSNISGTVEDKYIENRVEYNIVLVQGNGEKHHLEVTKEQYDRIKIKDTVNTSTLDQVADD